jgi:monooxygenase
MTNSSAGEAVSSAPLAGEGFIEHFDVLIIGAGLSGVGAAFHLQNECPRKTFVILEAREAMGGTWDLFRYPGVRSDSDMYTLGYTFRPWREPKAIADGPSILNYIRETASEYGIDKKIRYGLKVQRARWSSSAATWTVDCAAHDGREVRFTANFIFSCTGYYNYDEGYMPGWHGMERFSGTIVHPQKWPANLDYKGKRVVVIGSGATAVTLVPAMARTGAAHVTMLQRSPTYIVRLPSEDKIANWLKQRLPRHAAHKLIKWKNVLISMFFYNYARKQPHKMKARILKFAKMQLPDGYDVDRHFSPRYNPWDQRLCVVPDGDLFRAIRKGGASIVTDEIDTFTEKGIRLKSGDELEADIIVTATGLKLKLLGGMQLSVDGLSVNPAQSLTYKGTMYSGIPNLASAFGYTNASWTLRSDLTAQYVCRLLKFMEARGYNYCTPQRRDPVLAEEPVINFSSGYVLRGRDVLPKQGSKKPWRLYQNYLLDMMSLRYASVDDGTMEFGRAGSGTKKRAS